MNCKRFVVLVMSIGLVGAAAMVASSVNVQKSPPEYRAVPGWAKLPKEMKLGSAPGVAVDSADRVYVFHRGKRPIVVFDANGTYLRSWGDGLFKTAHGLRIDDEGNIWTTDLGFHLVRKFNPQGKLLLTLGTKGKPGVGENQFNKPADVALARDGYIYVADGYGNNRVVKFSKDGKYVKEWGTKGKGPGQFNLPHGILIHNGRIVVADRENDRVQMFTPDGKFLAMWKKPGAPFGLTPLASKHFLLADGRAHRVNVLDANGNIIGRIGMKGMETGHFNLPHGICVDSKGAIYVAEINGRRVQKFVAK